MRIENGIKYYEDGERVLKASDWFDGLEEAIAAIAYHLKENDEYVTILAEAVTKADNKKIIHLISQYDDYDCVILRGTNIARDGMLLL